MTFFQSISNAGNGRETLNLSTPLVAALVVMYGVDLAFEIREKREKSPPRLPTGWNLGASGCSQPGFCLKPRGSPETVSFTFNSEA